MNKKSIVSNIIWSVISLIISTIITMTILPYISEKIGIEAYGYIALCNNIITYIDLVASTINVYAIRFISIEYHKNNKEKANIYYGSILVANIAVAIALIIPATLCVVFIDKLLDVPANLTIDIRVLFTCTLLNYVITLLGTVFATAAFIKDILYKDTRIKAEGNILKGVILLILFVYLSPRVWYVTIATIASSIFVVIKNVNLSRKYVPELKANVKRFSGKAVKEIASNGIWNTIASLGTTLNSGLDLLVTNIYLGASKMGQLSVPKTLSNFITVLLTAATNSFRPQLLAFYSKGENEKMNNVFLGSMKFCGIITCTIFSAFIAIGYQFLELWIPNQDTLLIFRLTLLTFLAETFTGFVKPLHYGCVLTGKLKLPCVANLLVGLFNILSMILFLNITNGGLYVVAITTVVGNIAYNFFVMPVYVTKILNMSQVKVYLTILKYIISTILITAILYMMFGKSNVGNWTILVIYGILSVAIAIVLYIMLMLNKEEKRNLLHSILDRVRKMV